MSSLLVVEGNKDKLFLEAFIAYLNSKEQAVDDITIEKIEIGDFELLDGLDRKKLKLKLDTVRKRIQKEGIDRVGIILDLDDKSEGEWLELINGALKDVYGDDELLKSAGDWAAIDDDGLTTDYSCYFTSYKGGGNLESLLIGIKTEDSPHADCLQAWKSCIESKEKKISESDFNKLWIEFYHRYDCCKRREKYRAAQKCSFEASLKKPIYNYDDQSLSGLKSYLHSFSNK